MSFDIALLGIDGIGKSSVSDALAGVLRRQGFKVTITSWQRHLRGDRSTRAAPDGGTSNGGAEALYATYDATLRTFYSACLRPDGGSAEGLLPRPGEDLFGPGAPGRLNDPDVEVSLDERYPAAFLAAGLMETAARLIERDFVIRPALARGEVVIQESHGFKNILKMGVLARTMTAGRSRTDPVLEQYFSFVHRCIAQWAPPTQPIMLCGDPRLAYRWRKRQRGRIPRAEHAGISGEPTEASFVELQSGIQSKLLAIAEAEDWPRVEMVDKAREENLAAAVGVTLAALADRNLVSKDLAT